jgi:Cu/Ag efflux pump CusA
MFWEKRAEPIRQRTIAYKYDSFFKPHNEWRAGKTKSDIIDEINNKLQNTGVTNGFTQPIINRINMLSTGIRTDVGVKIYGPFRYHRSFGTKKKMALKGLWRKNCQHNFGIYFKQTW